MQIRSILALRALVAGALLALTGVGAQAAPPTPHKEASLVGVPLRAGFSDVLRKFGQPTEIQIGSPVVSAAAQAGGQQGGARGMQGGMAGMGGRGGFPGMPGMGGMMPGGMQGGMAGMGGRGGFPGMPGMGGMMPGGMPGMAGMGGQMPGAMTGPAGGGLPGFSSGAGSGANLPGLPGGGMPGMGGQMPGGMSGYGGMNGYGGMGGANSQPALGNETTWWYHFPKQGLHYSFLFDRQGRVIQIQAYGYKPAPNIPAARTAEGITLGASLADVIRRYGWSSDGDHTGDYVVLRYGSPDQIAFQSRHNQVIGIVLGVVK